MIPKIIHYCWFGGKPLPENVIKYIDTWKIKCPNYQIIQWDESNFDLSCNLFVKQAYEHKKWAFVSDYVRLKVLYDYGGIYLDTDVELLKSFDSLLENKAFFCAESNYSICTATIGAEKGSIFIKYLMDYYSKKMFIVNGKADTTPNSRILYDLLHAKDNYNQEDNIFLEEEYTIYPAEYFSPINCYTLRTEITDNTYSIHWYSGTWKTKREKVKDKLLAIITRFFGENIREQIKKILKK